MNKFLLLSILICFSTQMYAQWGWGSVKGNGQVISQTREIKANFQQIKVATGLNLYVTQGSSSEVIVKADENIQELIKTEVKKGLLKIYVEKSIKRAKQMDIFVTLPTLTKLSASSAADAIIEHPFKTDKIVLNASSGADIKANIKAQTIIASTSSGADIVLIGKTNYFEGTASSGSDLDAKQLHCKKAQASASSGADLIITVTEEITAKASSGGDVTYYGKPNKIDTSSSSGGDINRR